MPSKVPDGKVVLYTYVKPASKKFIQMEAIRQDVTESDLVEAIIEQAKKNPPQVLEKVDTRGRKKGAKVVGDKVVDPNNE